MVELLDDLAVFSDGRHNAWTGMAAFRGRYYVAFRNALRHTCVRSSIFLITSQDGRSWSPPTSLPSLDYRWAWHDNCQMFVFRERLFLRAATLWPGPTGPDLVGQSTIFTEDGLWWSEPDWSVPVGFLNWGTATFEGKLYGCFVPRNTMGVGVLASSDDGLHWTTISSFGDSWAYGLAITPEGEAFTAGYTHSADKRGVCDRLLRSRPPFTRWSESPLGADVHAPMFGLVNERLLMAGRIGHEKHMRYELGPCTAIFEFDGERFVERVRLPETYDCGYNEIVPCMDRPQEALISDYRGLRVGLPPNRWYPGLEQRRGGALFSRYEGHAIPARADIHVLRVRVASGQ